MIGTRCVRIQATFPSIFTSIRCKSRNPYLADDFERNGRFMEKLLNRRTMRDILNPSIGSKTAKGAPSFLVRSKGHTKTISRRQAMLNKHFLEGLTDVIGSDAEIGIPFRKYGVKVTQVETGQHYNILNIYWSLPDHHLSKMDAIGKELSSLAGILHKKMIERNFMGLMPRIRFNYDQNKAAMQIIESIDVQGGVRGHNHQFRHGSVDGESIKSDLKGESIKSDLNGESIKSNNRNEGGRTEEFQKVAPQPKPDHAGYTRIDPMRPRFWARKVALFVESQKEYKKKEEMGRFEAPEDMRVDARGLEYRKIMNRVLAGMKRVRSAESSHPLNPVADPLPPSTWVHPPLFPPDHQLLQRSLVQDTETRLDNMKSFVINYKKKQNRMFKENRRELDEKLFEIHSDLQSIKSGLEHEYGFDGDDFQPDSDETDQRD